MALSVIAPTYLTEIGLSGWQRWEDLLTAEFFGLLRYLSPHAGVLTVLAGGKERARDPQVSQLPSTLAQWIRQQGSVESHEIVFWPELDGGYPDVLVRFTGADKATVAEVFIEVKLYSPQSERRDDPRHQLARYMASLTARSTMGRASARALVYLTLDRSMPEQELDAALSGAGSAAESVGLFWLGWHGVAGSLHELRSSDGFAAFAPHEAAAVRDLSGILRARGVRTLAELKQFPLPALDPLAALDGWSRSWSLAERRAQ